QGGDRALGRGDPRGKYPGGVAGARSRVPGEPPGPRFARPEGKLRETRTQRKEAKQHVVSPWVPARARGSPPCTKTAPRRALGRDARVVRDGALLRALGPSPSALP